MNGVLIDGKSGNSDSKNEGIKKQKHRNIGWGGVLKAECLGTWKLKRAESCLRTLGATGKRRRLMARVGSTEKNIFMCLGLHILAMLGGNIKGQEVGRNIGKEIPLVPERQ